MNADELLDLELGLFFEELSLGQSLGEPVDEERLNLTGYFLSAGLEVVDQDIHHDLIRDEVAGFVVALDLHA